MDNPTQYESLIAQYTSDPVLAGAIRKRVKRLRQRGFLFAPFYITVLAFYMFSALILARRQCSSDSLWSVPGGSVTMIVAGVFALTCALGLPMTLSARLNFSDRSDTGPFVLPDRATKRRVAAAAATLAILAVGLWINYTRSYFCIRSGEILSRESVLAPERTIAWSSLRLIEARCGIAKGGSRWANLVLHMIDPDKDIPLPLHVSNPHMLEEEVRFIRAKAEGSNAKFYRSSSVTQHLCAPEALAAFSRVSPRSANEHVLGVDAGVEAPLQR